VVVVDEVVVVSPTVVEVDVATKAVGIVVADTDVVEVDETAVLVSSPPNERVKINPTISMTTKALAPMTTS
jgi:hypothetical protein